MATGTLELTDRSGTINGTFTRGEGQYFIDPIVLFIDSKPGGFNSTASFSDTSSDWTKAISGYSGSQRCTAQFASGFMADYAIVLYPGYRGFLFELKSGGDGSMERLTDNLYMNTDLQSSSTKFTFSLNWTDIGQESGGSFRFQSTRVSLGGNRYLDSFEQVSGAPSWGNTLTFQNFNVYGDPVPEPTTVALSIFGVVGCGVAFRDKIRRLFRRARN